MNLLLLAFGGGCGAAARYGLGAVISKRENRGFPLGTLLINLLGALLLGIFCGLSLQGNAYALLGDGFCGAFTTFSTFSTENVRLLHGGRKKEAALFLLVSVFCGTMLFAVGSTAAGRFKGI